MFNLNEITKGTILTYDVGYSMILPHFLEVDSITPSGKSLRVYELNEEFTPSDPPYNQRGFKVPGNRRVSELKTIRIGKYGPKYNDHLCFVWNGEPRTYDSMD